MTHCNAALMETFVAAKPRDAPEVLTQAFDFVQQFYSQQKG